MLLGLEEVGVGAGRVGLAAESEQGACGCQAGADRVAVGEGDGASCDSQAEGGEGAAPGGPGEASEFVCCVGQGLAPVEEGLVLVGLAERGSVADELPEVAGVGAVLITVLLAKVQDLVEGHGPKVESDLFEVGGDDVPGGGQRRQVERVHECPHCAGLRAGGLQGVARCLCRCPQQLREDYEDEGAHGGVQRDRDTVDRGPGETPLAQLFEDDLGQAGVCGTAETRVGDLGEGGVSVEACRTRPRAAGRPGAR